MIEDKINLLHVANSYGGTAVFKNMFQKLDDFSVQQTVFVPLNINNRYRIGSHNIDFKIKESRIIYDASLNHIHRIFYGLKIAKIFKNIENKLGDLSDYNLIHATTLCVDGAVAYEVWKKYKIPYLVSIRGTDVNFYYKKLFFRRSYFHEILENASSIIFISPSLQKDFINQIPQKLYNDIKRKITTLPNGVDSVFSKNIVPPSKISNPIKVLYYGGIQKNKNIHSTINSIKVLRDKGLNIQYTIIGKGLLHRKTIPEYVKLIDDLSKSNDWIKIEPSMSKEDLQVEISKHDIFVMPSFSETFGLAYVEALTQGLPIVYSKGQGFDGFFPEGVVGYGVEANNVSDISEKIKLIIDNYQSICNNISNLEFSQFDWRIIAEKYKKLYLLSLKNSYGSKNIK